MKFKRFFASFLLSLICILFFSSCNNTEKVKKIDSGDCGQNVVWELYEDGNLVISGKGDMFNLTSSGVQWKMHEENIYYVTVKNGVTSVGSNAFSGLPNLRGITLADTVTTIADGAFSDNPCLTTVKLSDSLTSIPNGLFNRCSMLSIVALPDSIINIGDEAFSSCKNLQNFALPKSLERIGVQAFYACSSLDNLVLPNTLTAIGNRAFEGCYSFTAITIPDSVTEIGDFAFSTCYNLTQITLPEHFRGLDNDRILDEYGTSHSIDILFYGDSPNKTNELVDFTANEEPKIRLNTDILELIGKTYGEIADAYDTPVPGYWEGSCVYFDNYNFCCAFQNYNHEDTYQGLPDSDDICFTVQCSLPCLIDGLDKEAYTFENLQSLLADIGIGLTRDDSIDYYIDNAYYYDLLFTQNENLQGYIWTPAKDVFSMDDPPWLRLYNK